LVNGADVTTGNPAVEGARVEGKVVKNGKNRKIMIFKYNAKKNYRRRQGHRRRLPRFRSRKSSPGKL
jgi:large subunit ribosomal protein L21